MDHTLRYAIVISAALHSFIFNPLFSFNPFRSYDRLYKPMEVDYVVIKEEPRVEMTKEISLRPPAAKTMELKKEAEVTRAKNRKTPAERSLRQKASQDEEKESMAEKEAAKKEARIKSTRDYVNYYQVIREKIRRSLKENYRYYSNEGEVYVVFVLRSDGTLLSYDTDRARSTSDENLLGIAKVSLIEASPFPPFPRALSVPKMSFNLTVAFKKR